MGLITILFTLVITLVALNRLVSPQSTEASSVELTTTAWKEGGWRFINMGKLSVYFTSYAYITIGAVSIVGNVLNAVIMGRQKGLSPYTYLTVLALCDLATGFGMAWMGVVSNVEFQRQYRFIAEIAGMTSVLMYFVRDAFGLAAIYLTAALSVDRMLAVKFPLHRSIWCTVNRARITCGILTISGLLIHTHSFARLAMSWSPDAASGQLLPVLAYTKIGMMQEMNDAVLYMTLLLKMTLPIVVMTVSNTLTLRGISHSEKFRSETTVQNKGKESAQCLAITAGVTITYFVTSLPIVVWKVYISIHGYPQSLTFSVALLAMIAEQLSFVKCCTNFFIYTIINKRFREDLVSLVFLVFSLSSRIVERKCLAYFDLKVGSDIRGSKYNLRRFEDIV
ncbi:hypothetical protein CAPTEDRAFT_205355 [Capitella teleta]|uniref:G-protein coupled receptors family 1 profile domain-containing protein n=1 Tax=Capitella teleta TaxID=283909 RepID=R7TMX1_CAPTE|nr:hypothetical protein CAPTEDRAFT_205355 [Capitella teleta]|eukprot:ELT94857.1 hypothetical protein CAPTEDRAFT_205355 [Capitella teleta]